MRRCLGIKTAFAISVGTNAEPMTTATRCEYCSWDTMPWVRPNSAEMVPNVSPVDMSRV